MRKKVVLVLGAGATVSDVVTKPRATRPPLDRGFFRISDTTTSWQYVRTIARFMRETYDVDITHPDHDSLEGVMAQIYTDLPNALLADDALTAFRALIDLFNARLSNTTNDMRATNKRFVYRIIAKYLGQDHVAPGDLTIITFNQDLQVEKNLTLMSRTPRWADIADQIFNFPGCYGLGLSSSAVSVPPAGIDCFDVHPERDDIVRVLKLHGSLNWFSTHRSNRPSVKAMFNPDRPIRITRRVTIDPAMGFSGPSKTLRTLPVIVPPVSHKSTVLHNRLSTVWTESEAALREADEIVVFGYSRPPLDFESSNQLRRSQKSPKPGRHVAVIDPDPGIASRYIALMHPPKLTYYPSARDFLGDR